MLPRATVRTPDRLTTGLLAAAVLASAAGPITATAAPAAPTASVDAPWVKTKKVTGKHSPATLTVTLRGQGPFTWTGHGSVEASVYGDIAPLAGTTPLAAGTHRITVSSSTFFRFAGQQNLSLVFTDALGAEAEVQTTVHVTDKAPRARITGASGSSQAAEKRTLRGKAEPVGPMKAPYRVYFRAPGEKKFTPIGRVIPDHNSQWKLRSTRVLPGSYVVKAESKYLSKTTSKKFTVKASAFFR